MICTGNSDPRIQAKYLTITEPGTMTEISPGRRTIPLRIFPIGGFFDPCYLPAASTWLLQEEPCRTALISLLFSKIKMENGVIRSIWEIRSIPDIWTNLPVFHPMASISFSSAAGRMTSKIHPRNGVLPCLKIKSLFSGRISTGSTQESSNHWNETVRQAG